MKNILYIRSGPYELNFDGYNLQEIGLGKALCKRGFDVDVLYYSHNNRDQIIKVGEHRVKILWRKGIRLLRSGVYPEIYKKKFLAHYDAVIVSEYSQIMSVLTAHNHPNVYVYNGPYYNLFKLSFLEPIYDLLFCNYLEKHLKKIFCKTKMSAAYLNKKGIQNTSVVGVGLDTDKFVKETAIWPETSELLDRMHGHRNLLYVGALSERKHTTFLIEVFNRIKEHPEYEDLQLLLIGRGGADYVEACKKKLSEKARTAVVWQEFVKNAQLKFVYEQADIFLLPSTLEIFGMVLLEAMYFGLPVVASHTAGADQLIEGDNGTIVDQFDLTVWEEKIRAFLDHPETADAVGANAAKTIRESYLWDKIADKMLRKIAL